MNDDYEQLLKEVSKITAHAVREEKVMNITLSRDQAIAVYDLIDEDKSTEHFEDHELIYELESRGYNIGDPLDNLEDLSDDDLMREYESRGLADEYSNDDLNKAIEYYQRGNVKEAFILLERAIPDLVNLMDVCK